MNIEDVGKRVALIGSARDDNYNAHYMEDGLWSDVLQAIANGAPFAAELAREALRTKSIYFERGYNQ